MMMKKEDEKCWQIFVRVRATQRMYSKGKKDRNLNRSVEDTRGLALESLARDFVAR
jgi:hypothetical protein